MSVPLFDVVLKGVLENVDPLQAQAEFARLFSLDAETVNRLFAAKRAVLKSNVNQETANKYITKLASIGVAAIAESVANEVLSEPIASAPESANNNDYSANDTYAYSNTYTYNDAQAAGNSGYSTDESEEAPSNFVEKVTHRFNFTGRGFEYFKIWIVNILLSILTLGIYSAWAKVRNKQYFYGNTYIADASFEYTAAPLKILMGRILAVVLYAGVGFAHQLSPMISAAVGLLLLFFFPWIIVSSLRFNARHTSYRNLAFRFNGSVWGALIAFVGWPLLGLLSLGILFPYVWKRQMQYITNNHSYGATPFRFEVSVKEYYKMLLIIIGASVVFTIAFGIVVGGGLLTKLVGAASGGGFDPSILVNIVPAMIAYFLFYTAIAAYFVVTTVNIHFNNTQLQAHRFESNWSLFSYLALYVTNTLGILLTLGLFIPFAKVRTAAYRAAHTSLVVAGSLDGFIAASLEESNAVGEGVHDIFDIDISM